VPPIATVPVPPQCVHVSSLLAIPTPQHTRHCAVLPQAYAGSRGPLQLAGIDALREGDFRSERSAFRFEIGHSVGNPFELARTLIAEGRLVGKELIERIGTTAPYQVGVSSLTEQLPNPENRVVPDDTEVDALGIPRPRLIYSHDDYTRDGLQTAIQFHHEILNAMGATGTFDSGVYGVGHLMGTYLMGDDPATSVTDRSGRTHDHANLYLAGSGLFPTSGTANPTLTLAALALLTADAIGKDLGVPVPATAPVASPAAD